MIPFFRPDIGEEEIGAVAEVIKSGHLTLGPKVKEFEEEFAKYIGHPYCIATNSLTNGYLMVLDYLKPEWVSLPSMTFVSMANIPRLLGMDIRFRDEIHVGSVYGIQAGKSILVNKIVDSAHQLERNLCRDIGVINEFCLFSFHANKNMTTGGEGGMVVCPDEKSYEYFKTARYCGFVYGKYSWDYQVNFPGWYAHMTDLNAAIGLVQLKKLDRMNMVKKMLVDSYNKLLSESNRSLHLYTIFVDERDRFVEYMKNNGVEVSVHYKPIHMQPAYRSYNVNLPKTEQAAKMIVSLPLYIGLKASEVRHICDLVNEWRGK